MVYNNAPFALLTKAGGPIKSVKDLPGSNLAHPPAPPRSSCCRYRQTERDRLASLNITQVAPNLPGADTAARPM